jgi:hypothetical protein
MVFEEGKKWDSVVTGRDVVIKGIGRNTDKGACPLCLGEEDVKHILLHCWVSRNRRMKF